jgi:hypothetical protein
LKIYSRLVSMHSALEIMNAREVLGRLDAVVRGKLAKAPNKRISSFLGSQQFLDCCWNGR